MRLQHKVLGLVLPLTVLPLLGLGVMAYNQLLETARARSSEQIDVLLDRIREDVGERVETLMANATLFSNAVVVKKYAVTTDEGTRYRLMQPTLLRLFQSYLQAYPDYREIRILLPDGYEDARATAPGLANHNDEELAETPFFQALKDYGGTVYTSVLKSPDDGQPVLYGAKALRLTDSSKDPVLAPPVLRGYLVVTMGLGYLAQLARDTRVNRSGTILFADTSGTVLFHSDPQQIGTQVPPAVRSAFRDRPNAGVTRIEGHFDGEPALWATVAVHDNLFAIVRLPESDIVGPGQQLRRSVVTMTIVVIALTALLMYVAINRLILNPIHRLRAGVSQIESGSLQPHIDVTSQDELGELATAVTQMGAAIQRSAQRIQDLAYRDPLTGLPNRLMFTDVLEAALAQAQRQEKLAGLLFLDMDNFKRINDTLGHHVGDLLLKEMAQRLVAEVRIDDYIVRTNAEDDPELVARLGGDEFIVVLPLIAHTHDAALVAQRLLTSLTQPYLIDGHSIYVTVSIGITLFPIDTRDVHELIKCADLAMYQAKSLGKNSFQFYSARLQEISLLRLTIENELRSAIGSAALQLHYQPIVDASSGEIRAVEALIRWTSPILGVVPPDHFLPVAEETGLIVPLGNWVLLEACRQMRQWHLGGLSSVPIAVNIAATQLERQNLRTVVHASLESSGLAPRFLMLELTETRLPRLDAAVRDQLTGLHGDGIRIALDDFGTGQSTLTSLRQLPVDTIKIDRSFIENIEEDVSDVSIVAGMLAMAHALRMESIVEGIERLEQLDRVRSLGCTCVQGFLFSQPVSADEMAALLAAKARASALRSDTDVRVESRCGQPAMRD